MSNISTSSPLPSLGINPLQDLPLFLISRALPLGPSRSDLTVPRTRIGTRLTSGALISTQKALRSSQRLWQVLPWVVPAVFRRREWGGDTLPFPSALPSPVKDPHLTRRPQAAGLGRLREPHCPAPAPRRASSEAQDAAEAGMRGGVLTTGAWANPRS